MITIQDFCFSAFQENTYIIYNEHKEAIIIDPGCYTRMEQKILTDFISTQQLTPKLLLNTHCHLDHVFGNKFIYDTWGLPLHLHENEKPVLDFLSGDQQLRLRLRSK